MTRSSRSRRRPALRAAVPAGLLLAVLAAASPVPAQTTPDPVAPSPAASPKPFKADVEVGAVLTEGNTRTRTGKGSLGARYETRRWRHTADLEALYAQDRGQTTAQRFVAAAKTDYRITEVDYAFVTARYEEERFTGFDYRVSEAAGYGRRLLTGPRVTLDVEAGPGGRHTRLEDGRREDEVIGRAALRFGWNLSPTAALSERASTEVGEDGAQTESETALRTQIIGNLAMKASFTVRHRSEVPAGTRRTDTVTAVTLVYSF